MGVRGLNVSVLGRLDVEDELGAGLGDLSAPGTDGLRVVGAVGTGVGSGGGGHLPQTLAGEESLDADDPLGVVVVEPGDRGWGHGVGYVDTGAENGAGTRNGAVRSRYGVVVVGYGVTVVVVAGSSGRRVVEWLRPH